MDVADRQLFADSLRRATTQCRGADLDAALIELGWHDALAAEPQLAISLLFEMQGAATTTSSALDAVVLDALGCEGDCVVLPDGMATAGITRAKTAVVVQVSAADTTAATVSVVDLEVRPTGGLDPELGLMRVTGASGRPSEGVSVDWGAATAAAHRALGHELVGVARTMLELAREHALSRIQFGQPISAFQAVRHRLAESLVAIETAHAGLEAAWLDGSPQAAAMGKALAGRGARTVARHCQQVLAGIGFTMEHPFHRSFRRALVLDELFGSAHTLTRALGEQILATRQLPPLVPL